MPEELDQALSSLENYWDIALRRRWWILISVFLTWATVWGTSWLLPSMYQSEALILLQQRNVPNEYVVPNVTASVQDRLQTITQQVLSRTRLQAIIDRFHLYPDPHGINILLESRDQIQRMRKDIEIELVPTPGHPDEFTAFKMRYTAQSPKLAQQVNEELTSPFVNENVEEQEQLSEDTTSFLENQLTEARTRMEEQEAEVAAYKAKHLGGLPDQVDANVQQILAGIQAQLQNSHQALEAARQRKLALEAQLQQYQSAQAIGGRAATGNATRSDIAATTLAKELDKELTDLRLRLQDLQERYTDEYPDVVALKDKIAQKEKLKRFTEDEMSANPGSHTTTNAVDSAPMEDSHDGSSPSVKQLESQLKANEAEILNYQKRERDLESQVSAYLSRLNTAPETEQELTRISQGYEESKAYYNSLLQKQMQSQLATSLEQRQKGEQFRILDPPSLPVTHVAPNRFKFSIGGVVLGTALGMGIVLLLELTDIRVRREKDLEALVPVPVLVNIPRLSTPREDEIQGMARWVDFSAAMIVVTLIAFGNVYAFFWR